MDNSTLGKVINAIGPRHKKYIEVCFLGKQSEGKFENLLLLWMW